jgi:excinuclease ABC subunit A
VVQRSLDDNVQRVLAEAAGQRIMVLAPALRAKAAVLREELPRLRQRGFQRIRLDGEIHQLDDPRALPAAAAGREYEVQLVVDRLVATARPAQPAGGLARTGLSGGPGPRHRLAQADANAPWREFPLSQSLACERCGDVFEKLTPRHFSFNHSEGACPTCGGLGRQLRFVPELVVPDSTKSVRGGALKPWRLGGRISSSNTTRC